MWTDFYKAGGWGMHPTSIIGFLLVASAVLLVLRPERRYLSLVVGLGLATLGSGLLSCSVGVIKTFHYLHQIPPARQVGIAALGCAESLNNVVLALLITVPTTLLVTIGLFWSMRGDRSRVG